MRYRLALRMFPATEAGAYWFPTKETLAVTGQLDQLLNEVWFTLVLAAGQGNHGPFSAADVAALSAEVLKRPAALPYPLTAARVTPRLRKLADLGLVVAEPT